MGGHCVRLTRGAFDTSTSYSSDPVEMARSFEQIGVKRLHLVDLDGARTGSPSHHDVVRAIKAETNLIVDFGGGIRSHQAVEAAFDAGADMLSVGSVAVKRTERFFEWVATFGPERFIFAADARGGFVTASGWSETTATPVGDAIARICESGVSKVLVTDVAVDGTLEGPSIALYQTLRERFPELHLIASGGVGSEDDLIALRPTGVDAVIVGKAIYEGRIRLEEFV